MGMFIQNRSVLYKTPELVLVPEGVYEAELVEVKEFSNAFGNRVGLVFKITTGQHEGVELMESVHDAADALLTMRGHPERQRGYLAGLPFTVRLVLCMWLTDTELAAKLIRVAYSRA